MEVARVDHLNQFEIKQDVRPPKAQKKKCLYDPQIECAAPKMYLEICRTCPRATSYVRQNILRLVFERVKALAIMLLNSADVQLSK